MQSDGITIKPRYGVVYFDDIQAKTQNGIECEQHECQDIVHKVREKLFAMIAANPKDLMSSEDFEEYGDVTNWISEKLNLIEEDLSYSFKKEGRLEILQDLLYEWEDSLFKDRETETIYCDVDFSNKTLSDENNCMNIIFPDEKFKNEEHHIALSIGTKEPSAQSIEELFDEGMENIDMMRQHRSFVENTVFAIVNGKLFTTYTGQWLFRNNDLALEAIKHRLNVSLYPYAQDKFIKNHPEFFESICKYLDENDAKKLKTYATNENERGNILSKSYSDFYELINKGFNNLLLSKIKFIKVSDIIK